MAGKSVIFSNDLLKLIFHGTTIEGIADNDAAGPLTQFWIRLHTADPDATPGMRQAASEATYTGYAAVALNRNSWAWTITDDVVSPTADIVFGKCTAGAQTLTHMSVGTDQTGIGKVLYSGTLTPSIAVSVGVRPIIEAGTTIQET